MANILVVGAHPDDEVLGVGGTLAWHRDHGDKTYVCIISEGASAQYKQKKMISVRRKAAQKAAKILGVSEIFLHDLPDSKLESVDHIIINAILEKCVARVRPSVVYTHFKQDVDLDHRRVFDSTMVAVRPKLSTSVRKVLSYEVPGQTHWLGPSADAAFVPDVFIDISRHLSTKFAALKCYDSEIGAFPFPRSLEGLEALAKWRGLNAGLTAAEGFMLMREVIDH